LQYLIEDVFATGNRLNISSCVYSLAEMARFDAVDNLLWVCQVDWKTPP